MYATNEKKPSRTAFFLAREGTKGGRYFVDNDFALRRAYARGLTKNASE